ncbi:MAG: hypothetical protein JZU47_17035 [Prolixibacteraceae bacterium]|nr:hypothetical protein [Prolixibacteraceae bacterium]
MVKTNFRAIKLITFLTVLVLYQSGFSQGYKLNFGLSQPQDPATLPVSTAKPQQPVRKAKTAVKPELQQVTANEFILKSGWEMAEADKITSAVQSVFSPVLNTSEWYNATVPGTVLTTLVDQGVYPDPYYGLNNLLIPDSLCRKDWWYRLELPLPENASGKTIWLLFNGINYKAGIWLNGKKLGNMAGAFIRGKFDATRLINLQGKNILAVHIYPPNNPGIPHEESSKTNHGLNGGQLCLDGPTFISSEGWDWIPGIRDRNIGIWQDVRLRLTDNVTIIDPQVITDLQLPDTTRAAITIKTELKNHSGETKNVVLEGRLENLQISKNVLLQPGETKQVVFSPEELQQLNLQNPRLWWPNGYGNPELYQLRLEVKSGEKVSDRANVRFGIREFSYELTIAGENKARKRVDFNPLDFAGKVIFNNIDRFDVGQGTFLPKLAVNADISKLATIDSEGKNPFLTIRVNGIPVFCKGGNWGMDDGMKRVSRERLEPYFRLHRDAHYNMVRNWTGESTEAVFYELCDEYGMLVWNDFWLSTEGYNLDVNDNDLFMANATDVVRRFRNHPSIAIWCPRNEGYATVQLESRLQQLIANEDGTRHYVPNSRNLNLRPSGPWHYMKNEADYYRNNAEGFSTEVGTPSIPTAETMKSFIPEEDRWPISDTWYYHDLHDGQKEYLQAIESRYGKSESLDDLCRKAQLVNYDSHRAMFESWNSKLWKNASGLLLWMTHPAWPSTVWQTYSWDYETFGSFYGSQKACEPVHIQMNLHDNKVVVINTTLKNYAKLQAKLEIFDLKGKKLTMMQADTNVDVPANQLTECFKAKFPFQLPNVYLVRLTLSGKNHVFSQNEYWKSSQASGSFTGFNELADPGLTAKLLKHDGNKIIFVVSNASKVAAIGLKFNLRDPNSGKLILPAWFSDGYFSLLPGEKKQMVVEWNNMEFINPEIIAEGYNMVSKLLFLISSK